ncbi:hypothetical protein A8C32_11960 [Flavivirga aquatica]|uniref:Uncharacterized protein n=1 Tax=Flavivirga aquatica TaxID=1849968 RepID=A0A1E5TDH7_9FLAO|nr:hypothetical protein [Flavivirga aquatica]OEK09426.1 hypothetical protein A8C32_11960 [Flavivirga aquatica]
MQKKRFSLLIDEDNRQSNKTVSSSPSSSKEDARPHFSLFDKKEEDQSKKTSFSRRLHYWLIENRTSFLHRTYGIKINYSNEKIIHYMLEVVCTSYKKGVFSYTLNRDQFFKNGKRLEGFMEQLAEQSVSCLYPLKVSVSEAGQIIGVNNQEDIETRWETKQKELAKRYSGKSFVNYCKKISHVVSSPEKILKSLNSDVVYDILFSKIYINYTNKFTKPLEKEFKWFSSIQKIRFQGNQSVNPVLKENNRMLINYQGSMQPVSVLNKGETAIKYQLDAIDHTLLRVDGTFNYTNNNVDRTIQFSAIWRKHMDKTAARKIEDKKQKGIYIDPNAEKKWYEFWK